MKTLPLKKYDVMPKIKIGNYLISNPVSGKLWIEDESGEGGEFREDLFAEYVKSFFNRFF